VFSSHPFVTDSYCTSKNDEYRRKDRAKDIAARAEEENHSEQAKEQARRNAD